MKDYQEALTRLAKAQKKLYDVMDKQNYSTIVDIGYNLAKVKGMLEAWDTIQEHEIEAQSQAVFK